MSGLHGFLLLACPACARDSGPGASWWIGGMLLAPFLLTGLCVWAIHREGER